MTHEVKTWTYCAWTCTDRPNGLGGGVITAEKYDGLLSMSYHYRDEHERERVRDLMRRNLDQYR